MTGSVFVQAGYDVALMHGGDTTQNALSEPLHVAIAGRDVPDYDIVELLIDAGLSLECKVYYVTIYPRKIRFTRLSVLLKMYFRLHLLVQCLKYTLLISCSIHFYYHNVIEHIMQKFEDTYYQRRSELETTTNDLL